MGNCPKPERRAAAAGHVAALTFYDHSAPAPPESVRLSPSGSGSLTTTT